MSAYFLGKLTGSVFVSLILAYCLVWIWGKLKKRSTSPKIKTVLVAAVILLVLSLLGNL